MAATRVYILAKELSVKSTAIVQKCQDEGLDVKNHMSTISAGLAATIREWFSEGENVTTVETSEKVDLDKVRVKKPKRKKPESEEHTSTEDQDTSDEVEASDTVDETVVEDAESSEPSSETELEEVSTEQVAAAEEQQAGDDESEPDDGAAQTQLEELKKPSGPIILPEPEPEEVKPAGPMLQKPKPAKLSGPQVVRIEAPEPVRAPRSRSRPRFETPAPTPGAPGISTERQDMGAGKGKKGGKRGRGTGRRGESERDDQRRGGGRGKWRQRDIDERRARLDAAGGEGMRMRPSRRIAAGGGQQQQQVQRPEKAVVSEPITVKDLSSALAVKTGDIIGKLMMQGVMATANQAISGEVAELVAMEFGVELVVEYKKAQVDEIKAEFESRERKHVVKRPVVAAMLGHVDHGKTSLLDRIRSSQVAAGEAGGITQHIGASQVQLGEKTVTFIDTPGHEAFTTMRARGANMTDVVVLVVAADDGVMPQTAEAIAHSKAAEVPIIVALNKIDLPGCDINRIYSQLAEHELTPTEWGGETEVVKTSAMTGEGIEDLLEHIDFIAELRGLEADDTIPATGWVIEGRMSTKRGPVATMLVKEGCLTKGDVVLAGSSFGRVKMLRNSFGRTIKKATSSTPVEIIGLNDVPAAGDEFFCLEDINRAKDAADELKMRSREETLATRSQVTMDNLFSEIAAGHVKELKIILKADVKGSVDVLKKYLSELNTDEVKVNILHSAVGGITEGDVVLAEASNAIIIGFNVVSDERAAKLAESKGVDIHLYNIIYRITEDLKKAMAGLLEPEEKENTLGRATIRQVFKVTGVGTVAGCYVTSGIVTRSAKARLVRNNIVIRDNISLDSLKHFKDDVKEVKSGFECGIKLAGFDDVKMDDMFEFYEIVKIARTLD